MKKLIILLILVLACKISFAGEDFFIEDNPCFYFNYQENLCRNSNLYEIGVYLYDPKEYSKSTRVDSKEKERRSRIELAYRTGLEEKVNFRFQLIELIENVDLHKVQYKDSIGTNSSTGYLQFGVEFLDIDYTKYLDYDYKYTNLILGFGYSRNTADSRFVLPILLNFATSTVQPGIEYYPKLGNEAELTVSGGEFGLGTNIQYKDKYFNISLMANGRGILGNHFIILAETAVSLEYKLVPSNRTYPFSRRAPFSILARIGTDHVFFKSKEDMNSWASVGVKACLF